MRQPAELGMSRNLLKKRPSSDRMDHCPGGSCILGGSAGRLSPTGMSMKSVIKCFCSSDGYIIEAECVQTVLNL